MLKKLTTHQARLLQTPTQLRAARVLPFHAFTSSAFQSRKMAAASQTVNKTAHPFERAQIEALLTKRFFFAPAFEIYGGEHRDLRLSGDWASHQRTQLRNDTQLMSRRLMSSRRCQGTVRLWTARLVASGQHH